MRYDYEKSYCNTLCGNFTVDNDTSFTKDITEEKAKAYMNLLEEMGLTRHETPTHYFYAKRLNCRETIEYRFWK